MPEGEHNITQTDPLGVEVQLLVYAFLCSDDPLLNNTVFTKHRVIYRGSTPMNSARVGFWFDFDLGDFRDDHAGIDTLQNTVFIYNGDSLDGDINCIGSNNTATFCDMPPAHTITFLNQGVSSFLYTSADPTLPLGVSDPEFAPEFYNLLSGLWRDGSPITLGNNGYGGNPNQTTNYAFPASPTDNTGWSMISGNMPLADYRCLPAIHYEQLLPGQILEYDLAHSFHQYPDLDHLEQADSALNTIPALQAFYDANYASSCSQFELCASDCVWPGDANNDGEVGTYDFLNIGLAAGQMGSGPSRALPSINWYGQDGTDWMSDSYDQVNLKHADVNGDGQVDLLDAVAGLENFDFSRPGGMAPGDPTTVSSDLFIRMVALNDTIDNNIASPIQRRVHVRLSIDTTFNLLEEVYGLAMSLQYDPSLIKEGVIPPNSSGSNSFFGNPDSIINHFALDTTAGRIDLVFCRVDGQNVDEFGSFQTVFLELREGIVTSNPDGVLPVVIDIEDLRVLNANGEVLNLAPPIIDTIIAINVPFDPTTGTKEISKQERLRLFPNPSSGRFRVEIPQQWEGPMDLEVFNLQGRQIVHRKIEAQVGEWITVQLPENTPQGLYLVRMSNQDGKTAIRRIVVE